MLFVAETPEENALVKHLSKIHGARAKMCECTRDPDVERYENIVRVLYQTRFAESSVSEGLDFIKGGCKE